MNSYCIRLNEINPPDLVFYLPLARNFKLQFGAFLLVVIPVCSVAQGPDVKTKLKIKEPKRKQDYKKNLSFQNIFNTGQFSCFNACLHKYLYWRSPGALFKEGTSTGQGETCTTMRRKYFSNFSYGILFLKNVILDCILLWAVSKHLVPQIGITKQIFLKDDYCMQFKCSEYLI